MGAEQILINVAPGETRIAILEGERLASLIISRDGSESLVGNIYLGRVETVLDGLQAAFVDIGEARSGFLSVADLWPAGEDRRDDIGDYVSEGDAILVQVLRDPEEDKGAKLTGRVVLTGRDLLYSPSQAGINLSRRISDPDERQRLMEVMDEVVPEDTAGGFILRTAAQEAEAEDLEAEVSRLRARWETVEAARASGQAPACLDRELAPVFMALRDFAGTDLKSVIVDDPETLAALKAYAEAEMPDVTGLLHAHVDRHPLFEALDVEERIDAAIDPYVALPSGGSLIISETPALTAIDVNTGSTEGSGREQSAVKANEEAAREITRQIRLRNLSGLIVVDFVSMRRRDSQDSVNRVLRHALNHDPLRPHVVGFTKLGLLEMTRRRRGASLAEILTGGTVVPRKTPWTVALEALRAVSREAAARPAPKFEIHVPNDVAEAFEGQAAAALKTLEERLGAAVEVVGEPEFAPETIDVRGVH